MGYPSPVVGAVVPFLSTFGENRPRFLENLSKLTFEYLHESNEGPCVVNECGQVEGDLLAVPSFRGLRRCRAHGRESSVLASTSRIRLPRAALRKVSAGAGCAETGGGEQLSREG